MRKNSSTTGNFYESQKEKSRIKTFIVTEFFKAYFPIIFSRFRTDIWYLDLFAGPGLYEDGSKSTPIVLLDILEKWGNNDVRDHLKIVFNDHDQTFIASLTAAVSSHPVYQKLRNTPEILCQGAAEIDLGKYTRNNVPIFSFVDPWGYKDVSAAQVWKLVKNSGSDCVLFFNANRILQDIGKDANSEDFSEIFGTYLNEAKELQKSTLPQKQKAEGFLKLFSRNLYETSRNDKDKNYRTFILPFYMEADDKNKISHYIVFISKNHKAIREMRKVMIKCGNSISGKLGYDDKTAMQVAMISRNDNSTNAIMSQLKQLFSRYPQKYNERYTIDSLSELLDRYSMYSEYNVLPYSEAEIKRAIEELDEHGHIEVFLPEGKTARKRITNGREFKIMKTIESE